MEFELIEDGQDGTMSGWKGENMKYLRESVMRGGRDVTYCTAGKTYVDFTPAAAAAAGVGWHVSVIVTGE